MIKPPTPKNNPSFYMVYMYLNSLWPTRFASLIPEKGADEVREKMTKTQ